MENTLDSIHPPEDPQEEMSYLFGRDPSILAYSQRPFPSKDMKKNLLSVYEMEEILSENGSTQSDIQGLQTVKVYLRLKPFPKKLKLTEEQQEAYKIINPTTLVTKLPMLDNNMSSIKQFRSNDIVCKNFTFSQTFGPETTQLELFEQTVQQQMTDFLAGHNCTIMTYGTTNSGKSYTLQGTITSPGLIPRALEFVFSNITARPNPSYKPLHHYNVVGLNALERAQELEAKTKLLTFTSVDKHQYMNAYKEMQKLLQEESIRPSECHDAHYSIWVSFAEIYNEIVYDLLSNECQKKRVPLKLGTDSHGRAFIKGLKTVYVNSAAEAYQVLMAGQYNLKVAATALNAKSSRSHCIFTITLLKYYTENSPDRVEMSMFSFCDLAGSERLKKTLNIGDRLKEAQNINTSLLVLGRCLKSIHEGQLTRSRTDAIGPFRESKLTRLFQRALSGKEHLALIVNVNPLPNLYVETQNVLNFAAIAKKIIIEEKKKIKKKLKSRFSKIVTQSMEIATDWDSAELESGDWQHADIIENVSEYVSVEEYRDLLNENDKMKKEIALLKNSAIIRDMQSRQEIAEKYIAMMKEIEIDWKQRITDVETQHEETLEWTLKHVEELYEKKLHQMRRKKRKYPNADTYCSDDSEEDNDRFKINAKELSEENLQLKIKNESLKKTLTELKVTNETLIVEKNKSSFELRLSKEDLKVTRDLLKAAQKDICFNGNGEVYAKEMTSQLVNKDEQIKKLKEILNEAKEEYITITSDLRLKELRVDDQAKMIIEHEEKIKDLELDIEQINVCLTEKTGVIEFLEEKLEYQSEQLSNSKNKILQLQEEIDQLKNEKLALFKSCEKPTIPSITITEDLQYGIKEINTSILSEALKTCDENEYQEIIIKEELIEDYIQKECEDSNIRENMQEIMENSNKNDLDTKNSLQIDISDEKADVAQNSESTQMIQSNVVESSINYTEIGHVKSLYTLIEKGCQTDMKTDENYDIKNNLIKNICYESTQTTPIKTKDAEIECNEISLKEKVVQTSKNDTKVLLEELTMQHNNIKLQYEQECLRVKTLTEELCDMKITVQSFKEENDSNKVTLNEYKQSTETLQKQLSSTTDEKEKLQETLSNSDIANEKKIISYKQKIDQLEKDFSAMKDNAQDYLEKLEMTQKELDDYVLNCKREKEINVIKSDESVQMKKECNINVSDMNIQQLDEHVEEIVQSEKNLETEAKLQDDIIQLTKNLEICQIEKNNIQEAFDNSNKKLSELEARLLQITFKEQEKDAEIAMLQKEVKHVIQKGKNTEKTDNLMEAEYKNVMNELMQLKEVLSQKEEYIKELKISLDNFARSAKMFSLLEENAKERQIDSERLRNVNGELRTNLAHKEREMDAFVKNRDETVMKYEVLVKNQQEELEREKREVMRLQELFRRQITSTPNKDKCKKLQDRIDILEDKLQKYEDNAKSKDYCDTTSEDEVLSLRQAKRRGRKAVLSNKQENIPVIELSGSESKRSTRRTPLPPPQMESSPEKRRTTRKKKLFVANDSFVDIDPENVIPPTPVPTRNLRNRKR